VDRVYRDPPFNSAQNDNARLPERDGTAAGWGNFRGPPMSE